MSSNTLQHGAKHLPYGKFDHGIVILSYVEQALANIAPDTVGSEIILIKSDRTKLVAEVVGCTINIHVERMTELDLGIARQADFCMQFFQGLPEVWTDLASEPHHDGTQQAETIARTSVRGPHPHRVFVVMSYEDSGVINWQALAEHLVKCSVVKLAAPGRDVRWV